MSVHVILEDNFNGHQGYDLYDPEKASYRVFRVRKNAPLNEFIEILSETLVSQTLSQNLVLLLMIINF